MNDMLVLKHISEKYQDKTGEVEALKDINLSIRRGEFISIVGPSGCGKSTLLSIISGLLKPTSGEIYIAGEPINGISDKVGYMLQKDNLLEWRTIYKNVILGLEIRHMLTKENIAYVTELLKTYGLFEFKDKYPAQLSGGMRQRAALIRTLATRPKLLLLDEAFSALDYQTRLAVSQDVYQILKKENQTSVMVSHDIPEAISMADRVVVLTRRPGMVKSIYEITFDMEEREPLKTRKMPEFSTYFNTIWSDLDVHL